jgi:dTDP-L-rhamnose 4-epimerase
VRVVVSGGAGFIGAHVAEQLVAAGHSVLVIDSLDGSVHAVAPEPLVGVEYCAGDVRDRSVWTAALAGADAVCHQAARVGLGLDFSDVQDYVDHNVAGTAAMLRAMHDARFGGRLVLASSMVVYGEGAFCCPRDGAVRPRPRLKADLERGAFEPRCPRCGDEVSWSAISEDARTEPRSIYAVTKLHQEHLCTVFGREHDIAVTSLRYHNVYGPHMPRDTPYAGVASIFRSQLERRQPPVIFEDGEQVRDFVHVSDVAQANVLALTADPPYDGALNVASGRPCTLNAMAEVLTEAFGLDVPPHVTGAFRAGDVRHVVASPERAWRMMGFRASVTPEEGLRRFASDPLRQSLC